MFRVASFMFPANGGMGIPYLLYTNIKEKSYVTPSQYQNSIYDQIGIILKYLKMCYNQFVDMLVLLKVCFIYNLLIIYILLF